MTVAESVLTAAKADMEEVDDSWPLLQALITQSSKSSGVVDHSRPRPKQTRDSGTMV